MICPKCGTFISSEDMEICSQCNEVVKEVQIENIIQNSVLLDLGLIVVDES